MWLPPWKYSPTTTLLPLPIVFSDSRAVCRMAITHLLTFRSSVMTVSWQGASEEGTSLGGIGCVMACASLRVRACGSFQPKRPSTVSVLACRFVAGAGRGGRVTFSDRVDHVLW